MADHFSEVSSQGWFSRIGNSIKGILVGAVLFLASFALLWWNEGRAVDTAKMLAEGKGAFVSVANDKVDPANEGKLIHVNGKATTTETVSDPQFKVSAPALKLKRLVEMYQWKEETKKETKKKLGGGEETITTYDYKKDWDDEAIDSADFRHPEGHQNPGALPFPSETYAAQKITLGAFTLSPSLAGSINAWEALPVTAPAVAGGEAPEGIRPAGGGYYKGADPANPQVGDVRVSFKVVKPADVSVVSKQAGESFVPYVASNGKALEMLDLGLKSGEQMFAEAEAANATLTWILRFVGWLAMAIGISMVFSPLAVVADVIPFLGDMLGLGIAIFAGLVAAVLSLITIAIAWFFYRPVLGVALLLAAVALVVWLKRAGHKKVEAAG